MDPITATLATSMIASPALSFFGQQGTNRMNREMFDMQMNYNERMANTAHQREVEDLRKAGLNPILSAGGPGAAVPGVTPPDLTSPLTPLGRSIEQSASSAMQLMRTKQLNAESRANTSRANAEAKISGVKAEIAERLLGLINKGGKGINMIGDLLNLGFGRATDVLTEPHKNLFYGQGRQNVPIYNEKTGRYMK